MAEKVNCLFVLAKGKLLLLYNLKSKDMNTEEVKNAIIALAGMTVVASITPSILAAILEKMRNLNDSDKKSLKDYVDTLVNELNKEINKKQSLLTSGVDIKTLNGMSLLGKGNITIQGATGEEATKIYVDELVTAIYNEIAKKQPALVSGVNIRTINGQSIIGDGNITIQGGEGQGSAQGTTDYTQLINKPSINGKLLVGNILLKLSEITNDAGFIKKVEGDGKSGFSLEYFSNMISVKYGNTILFNIPVVDEKEAGLMSPASYNMLEYLWGKVGQFGNLKFTADSIIAALNFLYDKIPTSTGGNAELKEDSFSLISRGDAGLDLVYNGKRLVNFWLVDDVDPGFMSPEDKRNLDSLFKKVSGLEENQTTLDNIKEAMESLPDGSAVSAQVAMNTNAISKLGFKDVSESGFYVVDKDNKIGIKFDDEGFDVAKISSSFVTRLKGALNTALLHNYYNALEYGITPNSDNNTPLLQSLIDRVSTEGGGIIYIPSGVYKFKKSGLKMFSNRHEYAIKMRSNVGIIGDGAEITILKQVDNVAYTMFGYDGSESSILKNCIFSNFSVDAYDTGNVNLVNGKAFFFQFVTDCVFRDITLKGTIATAMGIDHINRVVIDHINCIDCGRTYINGVNGTSGIGIGTGGFQEENLQITNCVCQGCGQYGIFIENQTIHNWTGGNYEYSNGVIISNNIIRGGLNKGIGVRGGRHVLVCNNIVYGNTLDGIYIDSKCHDVKVCGNVVYGNNGDGIHSEMHTCKYFCISGNNISQNKKNGIYIGEYTGEERPSVTTHSQSYLFVRDNNISDNIMKSIHINANITKPVLYGNISIGNNGHDYGNSTTLINQNNIEA